MGQSSRARSKSRRKLYSTKKLEQTRVRPVARNGSIYQISVDRRSLVRHSDVRPSEKVGSYLIERQHERLFVVEKPDSSVFRSNPIHRRELSGP